MFFVRNSEMRKSILFFSLFFLFNLFFNVSGIEISQEEYSFSIDGQDYTTNPDNLSTDDSVQGVAHVEDKHWFLSKEHYLDVFDVNANNYFARDNKKNLLNRNYDDDESKNPLANHLGDIDFSQKDNLLFIPLEHLYIDYDDSGYSVYEWNEIDREINLKKLVVLESGRTGSSAPYAAYNSVDELVYLHGYGITGDLCQGNRICGYNIKDTVEKTISEYMGNVEEVIQKREEDLSTGIELRDFIVSDSSDETVLSEKALNLFNELCQFDISTEDCTRLIDNNISYNKSSIKYLNSNDSTIHSTKPPEKVIVMTAECGQHWSCELDDSGCSELFKINGKSYCEVNHGSDNNFRKQGAAFSPNNRLLFYQNRSILI